jgi:hypothetical protein
LSGTKLHLAAESGGESARVPGFEEEAALVLEYARREDHDVPDGSGDGAHDRAS